MIEPPNTTDNRHLPAISLGPISDGIERRDLNRLRQRFHNLNHQRFTRMLDALTERQRQFVELIPLFWHLNHPLLPGFCGTDTPAGISDFEIDKERLRSARRYSKSLQPERKDLRTKNQALLALFVMGSVGTLAQSEHSDLDFWLCYRPTLNKKDIAKLIEKANKLSAEADKLNLEIHFFPMNCEQFRKGLTEQLDAEASGSAQHTLLLDEFYRTGIWLAGRDLSWWLIPSDAEDYNHYLNELTGKRFVRAREFIDLGDSHKIPAGEFVGAAIWQLYKAIESPYKSLLKLLLLEAYVSNYPTTETLAERFKRELYAGIVSADKLDPYVQIYRYIEAYLLEKKEPERIELVRRAFYFKAGKPLSKPQKNTAKSWQRSLLEREVKSWQWPDYKITQLDQRSNWPALDVIKERNLLVRELMQSYRKIAQFREAHSAELSISATDIKVLGNKLKAAFERRAGKIEFINPGISHDISLENPSLIFHPQDSQRSHWQLVDNKMMEPIKTSFYFFELLLWAHYNGVLSNTQATLARIEPSDLSLPNLQYKQICHSIRAWLDDAPSTIDHQAFSKANQCHRVLWLINTEPSLQTSSNDLITDAENPFSYGSDSKNLVQSIDSAWQNTWGELFSRHRRNTENTGTNFPAIVAALMDWCEQISQYPNAVLTVRCFTASNGNLLARRLEKLSELAKKVLAESKEQGLPHYSNRLVVMIAGHYYILQRRKLKIHYKYCQSQEQLINALGKPQSWTNRIIFEPGCKVDTLLSAACQKSSNANLQVFFKREDHEHYRFVIIDERGSVFYFEKANCRIKPLLVSLHHFLRSCLSKCQTQDIQGDMGIASIDFFEYRTHSRAKRGYQLHQHHLSSDLYPEDLIDIQAIAIRAGSDIDWQIIIDNQEFSSLDNSHYKTAGEFIIKQRQSAQRYPIHITRIDISDCQDLLCANHSLQSLFFLHAKQEVESRLNQAIQSID